VAAWQSHRREHKSKKRKRNYENEQAVSPSDRKEVRRALGI
jgi:ribosomal protein L35